MRRFPFLLVHLHLLWVDPPRLPLESYLIPSLHGASPNAAEGRLGGSFQLTWPLPSCP